MQPTAKSIKLVVLGDSNVGKTHLMTNYVDGRNKVHTRSTLGPEYRCKTVTVRGQQVKLHIWDTAGQERFRSVPRTLYQGAHAALLVYDITNEESFNALPTWMDEVRQRAPDCLFILIGNKCDLEHLRQVPRTTAQQFASRNGFCFLETSGQNGQHVATAFETITDLSLERLARTAPAVGATPPVSNPTIQLDGTPKGNSGWWFSRWC